MLKKTILLCLVCLTVPMLHGIDWYSSTQGNLWQRVKSPKWTGTAQAPVVAIESRHAQVIDGLGGTFNELGWDALCHFDEAHR